VKPDRAEIIEAVREVVPAVVAPIFGKDTCILASRIGQELLREHGVAAKDHTCRGWALNRQMIEFIGGDLSELNEKWDEEREQASVDAGAWSVGLGYSVHGDGSAEAAAEQGRFAGHVVLTTRNPDGILDLTLDQASRPEKDMELEPSFLEMDRAGLRSFENGTSVAYFREGETGPIILYASAVGAKEDIDHRRSRDWSAPGVIGEIKNRTLGICRARLKSRLREVRAAS
jgi:hypothetical protein